MDDFNGRELPLAGRRSKEDGEKIYKGGRCFAVIPISRQAIGLENGEREKGVVKTRMGSVSKWCTQKGQSKGKPIHIYEGRKIGEVSKVRRQTLWLDRYESGSKGGRETGTEPWIPSVVEVQVRLDRTMTQYSMDRVKREEE